MTITHRECEEAELHLEKIKVAKAEILLRFAEVTDPFNLNPKTWRDAKNSLMDVLTDAFYSDEQECEETIRLYEAAAQRQHARLESIGRH